MIEDKVADSDFEETEMSKSAREKYQKLAQPGSLAAEDYKNIKYSLRVRKKLSLESGELDYTKVYERTIEGRGNEHFTLIRRCIELNLTSEDVHEIIKARFRKLYGDWPNQNPADRQYLVWCKIFDIQPDENFKANEYLPKLFKV